LFKHDDSYIPHYPIIDYTYKDATESQLEKEREEILRGKANKIRPTYTEKTDGHILEKRLEEIEKFMESTDKK
jgi:hypothetical protein